MIFYYVRIFLLLATVNFFAQGQNDPCAGVTCSNRGTCEPNLSYSRGYWCECDDGWAGQDCLHSEPSVQCGDDQIDVVINKGLVQELEIDDDAQYVYFGRSSASPQCRAVEENNIYKLSIKAPFSSCGTQAIQRAAGDDYTFSNTVVWNREVHNPQNLIDRELVLLDFKCIYEDTYTVNGPSILPALNVIRFATEQGRFEISMSLFDDNTYTKAHEYTKTPTITIGTYVYVQVQLNYVKDDNLVVTIDSCFASQSPDPADPISTKHMLIADRCANPNDSTVQVRLNGESAISRFKFQMFKWRWSSDDVYLHCEVDICNKTSEDCAGQGVNCNGLGNFRKKRETDTIEGVFYPSLVSHPEHIVSQGPIHSFTKKERSSGVFENNNETNSTTIGLGVVLAVIFVTLGVLCGVYCRRRRRLQKILEETSRNEHANKHLSSLKFLKESF